MIIHDLTGRLRVEKMSKKESQKLTSVIATKDLEGILQDKNHIFCLNVYFGSLVMIYARSRMI